MKHFQNKDGIAGVRLSMGLSQEIFAMELGISRSLLSKVENKKRHLPTDAILKLVALEVNITNSVRPVENNLLQEVLERPVFDKEPFGIKSKVTEKETRLKIKKMQGRLDTMIACYDQLHQSLHRVEMMLEDKMNSGRFMPGVLEMHRYKLLRKLNKCDLVYQEILRNEIVLLEIGLEG